MSGQVDFIVAPEADAKAIGRDHNAIERWGGATWKWLDHTKLYALYGLLDGRFLDYERFCQECQTYPLPSESEQLIGELLREFEPGVHYQGAFLHRLPQRFVELLAALEPERIPELAAQWNASGDMRSWPRDWVERAIGDLFRLARQAVCEAQVLFMRISNLY